MVAYDILKALNVFCLVAGTMPFTVIKHPVVHLKLSPCKLALAWLFVSLTLINMYITPSFFIKSANISYSELTSATDFTFSDSNTSDAATAFDSQSDSQMTFLKIVNPSIIFAMSLSSHMIVIFHLRTLLPKFVDGFVAVDSKLTLLTKAKLSSKYHMSVLYLMMLFPLPTFAFYITTITDQACYKLIWSLLQIFHNFVSYSCELQLVVFCYALGVWFRRINESFPVRSSKDLLWKQTWLHPRDSLFEGMERLSVPRIHLAQECFLKVSQLVALLNRMYSVQILFSMSGCFMKALLNVYFAFFGAHLPTDDDALLTQRQINIIKTLDWTMYYSLRFLVQAMVATNTTEELYTFWKNASSQRLLLSGCGLFTLKSAVILECFSAGTTYLFVLIQYKLQIYFP